MTKPKPTYEQRWKAQRELIYGLMYALPREFVYPDETLPHTQTAGYRVHHERLLRTVQKFVDSDPDDFLGFLSDRRHMTAVGFALQRFVGFQHRGFDFPAARKAFKQVARLADKWLEALSTDPKKNFGSRYGLAPFELWRFIERVGGGFAGQGRENGYSDDYNFGRMMKPEVQFRSFASMSAILRSMGAVREAAITASDLMPAERPADWAARDLGIGIAAAWYELTRTPPTARHDGDSMDTKDTAFTTFCEDCLGLLPPDDRNPQSISDFASEARDSWLRLNPLPTGGA